MSKQPNKLTVEERVSPKTYQHLYQKGYRAGVLAGAEEAQGTIGLLRMELDNTHRDVKALEDAMTRARTLIFEGTRRYALSTVVWSFAFGMVFSLIVLMASVR